MKNFGIIFLWALVGILVVVHLLLTLEERVGYRSLDGIPILSSEKFWRHPLDRYPEFRVDSNQGSLTDKDLIGKLSLFYFGYTFCPDVCPVGMANLAEALGLLSDEERELLNVYFVTGDPERDDQEKMKLYTSHFDRQIQSLRAELSDIEKMANQFGVEFHKHQEPGKKYYSVDHSSFFTLVSRRGKIEATFPHVMEPAELAQRLRSFLQTQR